MFWVGGVERGEGKIGNLVRGIVSPFVSIKQEMSFVMHDLKKVCKRTMEFEARVSGVEAGDLTLKGIVKKQNGRLEDLENQLRRTNI